MEANNHNNSTDLREKWLSYWRRRRTFWAVAGVMGVIAVLVALLLPGTYRSTATILIEQQEIPQEMVRSVITSFADQRVQVISQRVMTTKNLMTLIDRYGLYPSIREKAPREVLLAKMRDDIAMRLISADVVDPRSGRPTQATIAFSVSYESPSPDLALKVANDLTSLYLNENLTSRAQLSEQTFAFLTEQTNQESAHINDLDAQLAAFKEKHHDDLPELLQLNIQTAQRTELDLHESQNRIAALDSQRVLLESQLAQLSPNSQVFSDTGQRIFGTEDRLKDLKSKLAAYKALYGPNHPDVLSTQREVDGMEKEISSEDGTSDRLRQLSEAKAKLAALREKYSPTYPDVVSLQREIDGLEKAVQVDGAAATEQTSRQHADNPVYIQVKGQLDALSVDRGSEVKKRDELQGKLDSYEKRMAQSPEVERQYREMERELEATQLKYQEILSKQTEAQVAQNLETERKGEKFTLIEPPQPPEKPVSPNRLLIVLGGTVLAVALGFGAVVAREVLDASVRGPGDIRQLLQVPALVSIPLIVTASDRARHKRFLFYSWSGTVAALLLIVVGVHFFVRPLDVVWLGLWRRFGV
jgi:succinoglycan biosynthesis transport protein ExoP